MTHDTEALKSLLAKVEAATGPDQILDFWLGVHLSAEPINATVEEIQADIDLLGIDGMYIEAPYTASIDAALALVERVLPGHKAGFQPCIAGRYRGHILAITETSAHLVRDAVAPTAPLAILGSLLEALTLFPERSAGRQALADREAQDHG